MLDRGQAIVSPDGRSRLVLNQDGDLVLYRDTTELWTSGTGGQGADRLVMQYDGNLVLYRDAPMMWGARLGGDGGGVTPYRAALASRRPFPYGLQPVWASETRGFPGAALAVRDDGGAVIRQNGSPILWSVELPAPEVGLAGVQHVVYGRGDQMVWLVKADGTLLDSYPVSGRANSPKPGRYRVFSKSRYTRSMSGGITMGFMVRFAKAASGVAIGFHDLPVGPDGVPLQTEAELGQFRSAGCIRQSADKAVQLYEWAPVGTVVVVLA